MSEHIDSVNPFVQLSVYQYQVLHLKEKMNWKFNIKIMNITTTVESFEFVVPNVRG